MPGEIAVSLPARIGAIILLAGSLTATAENASRVPHDDAASQTVAAAEGIVWPERPTGAGSTRYPLSLAENSWDFTEQDGIPGFAPLTDAEAQRVLSWLQGRSISER